jgi:hypothetical protein
MDDLLDHVAGVALQLGVHRRAILSGRPRGRRPWAIETADKLPTPTPARQNNPS